MITMDTSYVMIEQLLKQSESCHSMQGADQPHLPIKLLNAEQLANTMYASEAPVHTGCYSLPMLNRDGTRTSFGYLIAVVDVFRDGTAIAKTREWLYAYRANEPSLDGREQQTGRENRMVVRHYLLGCQHSYQERNDLALQQGHSLFSHDHYFVCSKCGHAYMVDSSD
jgi:hypothetical protein